MADPTRWAHVKRLFAKAAALDPASRVAYLESVCAGDPELLEEVRSLLEWDGEATDFLDTPVARIAEWPAPGPTAADRDPRLGSSLGPWRLTELIGRGGMGAVYRAERADAAFQRQAAIKVVRVGRDSAAMIERFRRERETLASLDHPNIARLFDGGTTDDGQPYFVMELVDGVPIDRYCDEQRLTIAERLDVFAAVCGGVQYAHENLVIHQDIKPDNILVSRDGTPKLLDFGIARLLSDERAEQVERNDAATWLLTPDYASPEQVFGRTQTTLASDVYSLGVLLYVLLTGVRPYHLGGASQAQVQEQLREAVLIPPSQRALESRGPSADERARMRQDGEQEDEQKKGQQEEGQDEGQDGGKDEGREDHGEPEHESTPVQGATLHGAAEQRAPAPPRPIERDAVTRAAARRSTPRDLSRRLAGDLDAIVLRALGREASTRYSTVDQLALDLSAHRSSHPVAARGRDMSYLARTFVRRHAVALGALATLALLAVAGVGGILWQARAAAVARGRAEQRFEDVRRLAHTFMFDVHDAVLNIPGTAEARILMVRTAVDYLERLATEASGDRDLQRELAAAFVKVGDAQGNPSGPNLGDTTSALASYRRAVQIADPLVQVAEDDVAAARTLALAHRRLADVVAWRGDLPAALQHGQTSERLFLRIALRAGPTFDDRLQAAIARLKLGDLLGNPNLPNVGRTAEAEAHYADALAALRPLAAEPSQDIRARRYLGITLERIATLHEQAKRWAQAADSYRASFEIRQALAAEQPSHIDIQRDFAIAYEKLGNVERFMDNPAAAATSYRGALARFQLLAAKDPTNVNAARTVAIGEEKLGDVLRELGSFEEARALFASALRTYRAIGERDADSTQARCDAARVAEELGDAWLPVTPGRPAGPPPPAACAAWRDSLRAATAASAGASSSGSTTCANAEDKVRLGIKLARCS